MSDRVRVLQASLFTKFPSLQQGHESVHEYTEKFSVLSMRAGVYEAEEVENTEPGCEFQSRMIWLTLGYGLWRRLAKSLYGFEEKMKSLYAMFKPTLNP